MKGIKNDVVEGATHQMKYSYGTWYLRKNEEGQWERWLGNRFGWCYCNPSIWHKLFKLRRINGFWF